jgi:hypothetical protein
MDILKSQFLMSCRELVNGTYYYDNYDTHEKKDLQNILVSGMPFYDTVRLDTYWSSDQFKNFLINYYFFQE